MEDEIKSATADFIAKLESVTQQVLANKTAGELLVAATNQIGAAMRELEDLDPQAFAKDLAAAVITFDQERMLLAKTAMTA